MLCVVRRRGGLFAWSVGVVMLVGLLSVVLVAVQAAGTVGGVPGSSKAVFHVSSNKYIVNGDIREMDAAPFVFEGRAFVPVRYLGYACGVVKEDIIWDGAQRKATLKSGSKTVEFTVGSREMVMRHKVVVSPLVVEMDVVPMLKKGRIYVPARWGAEGLGYRADWDPASRTVTIVPDVIRIPPGGDF